MIVIDNIMTLDIIAFHIFAYSIVLTFITTILMLHTGLLKFVKKQSLS